MAVQLHESFIFHTKAGPRSNETNTANICMSRDIKNPTWEKLIGENNHYTSKPFLITWLTPSEEKIP